MTLGCRIAQQLQKQLAAKDAELEKEVSALVGNLK